MAKKIHDKNRFYFMLRIYVDGMFKAAYRRVEYYGQEKIPKDGAIIYAPNHTNTLMDALAVLAIDKQAKVFVARADVFKHPTALKILTFLKMLPINRMRDGSDNLSKNEDLNNTIVEVLHDKIPFCILPEGTHRAKHSLMPLQKGLFRIALQANDSFGKEMPVYIVPVGIEYGHFFRYRSSLLVQLGDPINVTGFVQNNNQLSQPEQINELRDMLSDGLKKVMLQINDDENYDATLELCRICDAEQRREMKLKQKTLLNNFLASKKTIRDVEELLEKDHQQTQHLLNITKDFTDKRHNANIGAESYLQKHIYGAIIRRLLLILLGFPYFVFSAIATAPVTLISVWVCSMFKDKAFHNTLRYLISFVLLPVFLLIIGLIIGFVFGWIWTLIVVILFIPSFFFLHEYLRAVRLFVSEIKWTFHKKLHKQLANIRQQWRMLMNS
jgi:1-acyl-sn-glycerol-3-phosphate acyltransferase